MSYLKIENGENRNCEKKAKEVVNVFATNAVENLSRHELLQWISKTADVKVNKVEDLCTGACYCKIMNIIFPKSLPINRVKFQSKLEHEYIQNYKILQDCFKKLKVEKVIDVDRVIKGRFQDNLAFLQWFKKFVSANSEDSDLNYGSKANFLKQSKQNLNIDSSCQNLLNLPLDQSAHILQTVPSAVGTKTYRISNDSVVKVNLETDRTNSMETILSANIKTNQNDDILELLNEVAKWSRTVEERERECDFYYRKLRKIEILCEKCTNGTELKSFVASILNVLYEDHND